MNKTWIVYGAVLLIAVSNAIKGSIGLYNVDQTLFNLVASVFLSVGVEALLFYAVMRWSADRSLPSATYAVLIASGAALLNWLFFTGRLEVEITIALASVGPFCAAIGGLVVGEQERNDKIEQAVQFEHEERMAQLEVEKANQERLIALHNRKANESKANQLIKQPVITNRGRLDKESVLAQMIARWEGDSSISMQAMSKLLPPSYGTIRAYTNELIEAGQLEVTANNQYIPLNGGGNGRN